MALAVTTLAVLLTAPARAADPVFPTGSPLGIVPPAGMIQSHNFAGFEDPQKNAAILFTTMPAQAYDALDKSMVPEAMNKSGIEIEKREPIQFSFGKGFLLTGKQTTGKARYRKWLVVTTAGKVTALVTVQVPDQDAGYTDKAMRDALATLAMRDNIPEAEQLSLVPFTVGDLAGFHVDEVLPGRALMLVDRAAGGDAAGAGSAADRANGPGSDQSKDTSKDAPTLIPLNARMFIAAMPGSVETGDRSNVARTMFQQIVGIKDVRIQDAEPLRIGNQFGFETLAKAKDAQNDTDVMVVQWLRFGTAGFLQMVGIVRADAWPTEFNRLRTVRDSIDGK
jgi:hypothetical protein